MTPEAVFIASWGLIVAVIGIGSGIWMHRDIRKHSGHWCFARNNIILGVLALVVTVIYFWGTLVLGLISYCVNLIRPVF